MQEFCKTGWFCKIAFALLDITNHFLCTGVSCDGSEGEDAIVQGSGVGYILEDIAKKLQQLLIVGLERFRIWCHNFAEQQQAHLGGKENECEKGSNGGWGMRVQGWVGVIHYKVSFFDRINDHKGEWLQLSICGSDTLYCLDLIISALALIKKVH